MNSFSLGIGAGNEPKTGEEAGVWGMLGYHPRPPNVFWVILA